MQAIRTRYIGPTNARGSRIQAKCAARTVYVHYDHALNSEENHRVACLALIKLMGWMPEHGRYAPMVGGQFGHDHYWVFADGISTAN